MEPLMRFHTEAYRALSCLIRQGKRGATKGRLGQVTAIAGGSQKALTQSLVELEKAGLVRSERVWLPKPGPRSIIYWITEKGQQDFDRYVAAVQKAVEEASATG